MAVKYYCTKCDRKFVEFGVEKVKAGDLCDDCRGEFLEVAGFNQAQAVAKKKPALKRKRKAKAPAKKVAPSALEAGDNAKDPDSVASGDKGDLKESDVPDSSAGPDSKKAAKKAPKKTAKKSAKKSVKATVKKTAKKAVKNPAKKPAKKAVKKSAK